MDSKTRSLSVCRHSPLHVSQILTTPSLDAVTSWLESPKNATEVTGHLCPSRVCKQGLHLFLTAGFIEMFFGASSS